MTGASEDTIAVALSANEAYVPGLTVAVASIIVHSRSPSLEFIVLDTGITDTSWHRFEARIQRLASTRRIAIPKAEVHARRLRPDLTRYAHCQTLRGTLDAYAVLELPRLVDRDKVLFFDADMLILKDVADAWNQDLGQRTAGAVFEQGRRLEDDCSWLEPDDSDNPLPYFNSGTLVLDLARWRQGDADSRVDRLIEDHGSELAKHDQTVLNYVLRAEVAPLDPSWNQFDVGTTPVEAYVHPDGAVVHITHKKPWREYKNLRGSLLWIAFHDRFVRATPAVIRYGVLWRIRKFEHFRSALRTIVESVLLRTRWSTRLLARLLERTPAQEFKGHWLRRWSEFGRRPGHSSER